MVTERERYFFDLNGYLLLKGALSGVKKSLTSTPRLTPCCR